MTKHLEVQHHETQTESQSIYQNFSKLPTTTQIPLPYEISAQQEHEQYKKEFKQTEYEPELNTQIKLSTARTTQSIFVLAEKDTTLAIEIVVAGEFDKQTQLEIKSRPIICQLIERQSKQIIKSYMIHKHRLITIVNSADRLYELKISLQMQESKMLLAKVVTIHALVDWQKKSELNAQWFRLYNKKITSLYDQSVNIFLDSLEKWTIIEESSEKYSSHLRMWKTYSFFELTIFLMVSILQLIYIRKLLHSGIVI